MTTVSIAIQLFFQLLIQSSCAFDTVNHKLLLTKLQYGLRGQIYKWLESYLSNRSQYVQFKNHNSDCRNVVCGIPQGSVIGPKLFILFINDISEASKDMNFLLFADDTTVFKSGTDINELMTIIEREMSKLKKWFDCNKLSLNWDKTNCMFFGNTGKKVQN